MSLGKERLIFVPVLGQADVTGSLSRPWRARVHLGDARIYKRCRVIQVMLDVKDGYRSALSLHLSQ